MTEAPAEPAQDPGQLPGEDEPEQPKAPDLPDPAFPEVLPGGEEAPDVTPDEAD
jgi:hypothetical protein